jgi:hypothetical protein
MSPLEYKLGANYRKKHYHAFKRNQKNIDWLWLFAFLVICACNGWFLRVSLATFPIRVFFAAFPVAFIFYAFYKNTYILRLSLMISWVLLAFIIGNFNLYLISVPVTSVVVYSINIFFFVFVLMDSLSESGLFILLFIGVMVLLLLQITGWEKIWRLIWYCNLMITMSNAGVRLQQYCNGFLKAMIALIVTATLGLTIGWVFAGTGV